MKKGAMIAGPAPSDERAGERANETMNKNWMRLGLLALVLIGLIAVGKVSGFTDDLDANGVRQLVLETGAWGWALYVGLFAGGEFVHVPGMIFVVAGVLIYGKVAGFGLAWVAAVVSVCFSFVIVRGVGGTPLAQVERPWLQRTLGRLDARPIRTVFLLRSVLWLAPPLNYALALTRVRFRDYLIGSALGLLAPVAGVALLFDWLFAAP